MSTPHLDAKVGEIADTVLLPGDPLRARFIAGRFLEEVVQVNSRRNMLGYTGWYRGHLVSVIGGGMGIPSTAIYATELVRVHGVRRILRVGTCGGLGEVALGDVLLAQSGSTDSNFNRLHFGGHDLAACADFGLLRAAVDSAARLGVPARVANVFSTDCFHDGDPGLLSHLHRHRIAGIEMETAGLYALAMREGVQALSLLSVSDLLEDGASTPPAERERGLAVIAELALECAFHETPPAGA